MNKKSLIAMLGLSVAILLLVACQTLLAKTEPTPDSSTSNTKQQLESAEEAPSVQRDQQAKDPVEPTEETDPTSPVGSNTENVVNSEEQEQQLPTKKYAVNPKTYRIEAITEGKVPPSKDTEEAGKKEKIALLTFDDTPTGDATYDILDILDQYGAKAIFFVNGHYAERNVDTLHEIKDRGHLIGNHTWWHIYIRKEDPETVRDEIVRLNDFLEKELGERPVYFRPPFGQNSDVSLNIIREEGMQTMNWSNGSLDWELKSAEAVVEQVLTNMKNGDNILFHDKQITAEALEPILKELTAQGYKFVLPTEVIVPE